MQTESGICESLYQVQQIMTDPLITLFQDIAEKLRQTVRV